MLNLWWAFSPPIDRWCLHWYQTSTGPGSTEQSPPLSPAAGSPPVRIRVIHSCQPLGDTTPNVYCCLSAYCCLSTAVCLPTTVFLLLSAYLCLSAYCLPAVCLLSSPLSAYPCLPAVCLLLSAYRCVTPPGSCVAPRRHLCCQGRLNPNPTRHRVVSLTRSPGRRFSQPQRRQGRGHLARRQLGLWVLEAQAGLTTQTQKSQPTAQRDPPLWSAPRDPIGWPCHGVGRTRTDVFVSKALDGVNNVLNLRTTMPCGGVVLWWCGGVVVVVVMLV